MRKFPDVVGYRLLGMVGAAILAGAGLAAGALPVGRGGSSLWMADWRDYALPALLCGYFGLTLMLIAWWWAGRQIPDQRSLLITLGIWSAPLVIGPPLFSRDVYSYLAQGAMVQANMDVYEVGVSGLGGQLGAQVPDMWQHTPTPYGPVFLGLAAAVVAAVGTKIVAGAIAMRIVALIGVGLLVVFLPRLARHCGVAPASALWLGVLNPIVPLHLIAGAHNEAMMLGLLVAGLSVAFQRRFALATVLVTLAALVKAPAAAGLLVVFALWLPHLEGRARHVAAAMRTLGIAALTTVAVTAVTGTGYGWITSLRTPIHPRSWSLTSALGRASRMALEAIGMARADSEIAMRFWVWCGLAAVAAVAASVWWHRRRLGPVYAVGLGLSALAIFGPVTRPWYALWGLIPIAAAAPDGAARRWAAVGSAALALLVLPSGVGPDGTEFVLAATGVLLAAVTIACGWLLVVIRDSRARTAS